MEISNIQSTKRKRISFEDEINAHKDISDIALSILLEIEGHRPEKKVKVPFSEYHEVPKNIPSEKEAQDSFNINLKPHFKALDEEIQRLSFSREYHMPNKRFPTHEEFDTFVSEINALFRGYNNWTTNVTHQLRFCKKLFQEEMVYFIKNLSKKIAQDALFSLRMQNKNIQNGVQLPEKGMDIKHQITLIDAYIEEFECKSIEIPLLELRTLLNVQHKPEFPIKADAEELSMFKGLWAFYLKNEKALQD